MPTPLPPAAFQVAFARVVMDGYNKELLPPPLNLLRALVLALYGCTRKSVALRMASLRLALALDDWAEPGTVASVFVHWLGSDGDASHHHHEGDAAHSPAVVAAVRPGRLLERRGSNKGAAMLGGPGRLLERRSSNSGYTMLGGPGMLERRRSANDDEHREEESMVAREVSAFLRKATDSQVAMLPEGVVDYVMNHQHDVAREERWRTVMQKELSSVDQQLRRSLAGGPLASKSQLDQLERMVREMKPRQALGSAAGLDERELSELSAASGMVRTFE